MENGAEIYQYDYELPGMFQFPPYDNARHNAHIVNDMLIWTEHTLCLLVFVIKIR